MRLESGTPGTHWGDRNGNPLGATHLRQKERRMPVTSFLGEIEEGARHFYATALRGEVSDASVRGYLRAASQIEDLWQQNDSQVALSIGQGVAPWEAYHRLRYSLAFIRAARTYQVFVRELLAADA